MRGSRMTKDTFFPRTYHCRGAGCIRSVTVKGWSDVPYGWELYDFGRTAACPVHILLDSEPTGPEHRRGDQDGRKCAVGRQSPFSHQASFHGGKENPVRGHSLDPWESFPIVRLLRPRPTPPPPFAQRLAGARGVRGQAGRVKRRF